MGNSVECVAERCFFCSHECIEGDTMLYIHSPRAIVDMVRRSGS